MSYQEKRTIVSLVTGTLILAGYCLYANGQYQSGAVAPGDLRFWAVTILTFIGITIAASIVIQILFHILFSVGIAVQKKIQDVNFDEKEIEKSIGAEMVEDEMGKLIELKSMRIGFIVAGIGFVLSLVSLVLNYSPAVMINIQFFSFWGGSLFKGATQLYYYRRGVANG